MVRETSDAVIRVVALAATVVLIAALASCGGDDDSDSATTSAGSEQAAGAQPGTAGADIEDFGEEAGPEDRAAAGGTVEDFVRALVDVDGATACSLMSSSVKTNLEVFLEGEAREQAQNTCPQLVAAFREQIPQKRLPNAGGIEVTGVRVEGDRGVVLYRDETGKRIAFPIVREGSGWKVAAIVGQQAG